MALSIPASVVRSYNNIVFPVNTKSKISEDPVISGDGRVVKYSKITISVSGYWTQAEADQLGNPGASLDQLMRTIRLLLQAPCKNLVWTGTGYGGDLNVNPPGNTGVRDVNFGPVPGKFLWWPLGGAPEGCHGAGFSWEVTTYLPECLNAKYVPASGIWSEISFSPTFETDNAGLLTVTTSGTAQIPLTLRSDNTLQTNVDAYFASIVKQPPFGFSRQMKRQLSPNRATCTFTITDKQMEVPPPPGVVSIDMRHRIKQRTISEVLWDCTITGTVRLQPTASKIIAWQRFFGIAFARIRFARRSGGITTPKLEMEEDLFKNEARFTITYRMLGTSLATVIRDSSLWTPVVNDGRRPIAEQWSAQKWSGSLATNAHATGGLLQAKFNNTDEVIIDVCNPKLGPYAGVSSILPDSDVDSVVEGSERQPSQSQLNAIEPINFVRPGAGGIADDQLKDYGQSLFDPDESWISWNCEVTPITDYREVRHKPLAGDVRIDVPAIDPLGDVEDVANAVDDPTPGWSATVPDIIQQTSSPSMILRLRGSAIRVAYRVNAPKLITYGDVKPVLVYESCPETTMAAGGGALYFRRQWDLVYFVPTAPTSLPLPANPFLGTNGQ